MSSSGLSAWDRWGGLVLCFSRWRIRLTIWALLVMGGAFAMVSIRTGTQGWGWGNTLGLVLGALMVVCGASFDTATWRILRRVPEVAGDVEF